MEVWSFLVMCFVEYCCMELIGLHMHIDKKVLYNSL
jgi:hypothetical protein